MKISPDSDLFPSILGVKFLNSYPLRLPERTEMATVSQTEVKPGEMDIEALKRNHTLPLWTQMTRLNPPLPNPRCKPHVWDYEIIRAQLLKAGELVTEKQAERRVLMLVNPGRGKPQCLAVVFRLGSSILWNVRVACRS